MTVKSPEQREHVNDGRDGESEETKVQKERRDGEEEE